MVNIRHTHKFDIGDKVKVVKDIDFPLYPKTATGMRAISRANMGKVAEIVDIREKDSLGKVTRYVYGLYLTLGLTWCAEEELERVMI
jgi:hypothetical protein